MTLFSPKMVGLSLILMSVLGGCVVVEDPGPGPFPPPGPPMSPRPEVCPQIYAPVCGTRGGRFETLPNECVARARGYRIVADGECRRAGPPPGPPPGPGFCTREYAPVCARRGGQFRTFGNSCEAENAGFRIVAQGEC